jgi:hypothetical protein
MRTSIVKVSINHPGGPPRTEGIHLSKVIRAIALESNILDKKYMDGLELEEVTGQSEEWWKALDPGSLTRICIGLAWDAWYLPNLGMEVVPAPGEMDVDGIYMTPDGESLDIIRVGNDINHELAIHEVKATYKSTNTVGDMSTQWMWLTQMKGYCKGAGCRVGYMHPLHLCGDYKYPITPQIGPHKGRNSCFRIEFTQEEIDESWDLITGYVQHRRSLEREDDAGLEGGV